jgi:hypothetical protein
MDEPRLKYIVFVPLSLNDGTPVEPEVILDFQEQLCLIADGYTIAGTVDGAYRMSSGEIQKDTSAQYWIWVTEDQQAELRRVVAELGGRLEQESMYLERCYADLDLVEPEGTATEESDE